MKRCIIFGCGKYGDQAYSILKKEYEVIAWSDNNSKLWGSIKKGIKVIPPVDLSGNCFEKADVFVCISKCSEVIKQLNDIGVDRIYIYKTGFFFDANMKPVQLFDTNSIVEIVDRERLNILFIADSANIRDHKMAQGVKLAGHHIYMAYILDDPYVVSPQYVNMYEKVFGIHSFDALIDFVNKSDLDIIHSSSEPDYITPLLLKTNKPVIHDCHDLRSSNYPTRPDALMIEYLAHKESSGVLYPTDELRDEAIKKYNINIDKTYTIENYVSRDLIPTKKMEKLSSTDGKIHCVYEGGVDFNKESYKYYHFRNWLRFAEKGIHIHFYTGADPQKCNELASMHDHIHYEGNRTSKQLSIELSQYDVGWCIYNINPSNRHYLECASPNKVFEYINAGIPVIVSETKKLYDFVEENGFGKRVDWNSDLYEQIKKISEMKIENNALQNRGMIFEDRIPGLIDFYKACIRRKKE